MADFEAEVLGLGRQLASWQDFHPRKNDTLENPQWLEASCRIAILRLSPQKDVEESLTHTFLFGLCKENIQDAYVDFSFFPPYRDQKRLAELNIPWPLGIQSLRPLADFDIILISLSYILELANIFPSLAASGLEPLQEKRKADAPLIILGGSSATVAQAASRLVDAFFFGEWEAVAENWTKFFTKAKNRNNSARDYCLQAQDKLSGLWVPGAHKTKVVRSIQKEYKSPQKSYPVLNNSHADTVRLAISLGCPFRCSFCFEGYTRKPYRNLDTEKLGSHIQELKKLSGAKSLDFVTFNANTHNKLLEIINTAAENFSFVHIMSQRLDILAKRPDLLLAQIHCGKRSFTLGIEGISERMRLFYQKDLDLTDIENALKTLCSKGIRDIKLFFILAGVEDQNDVDEFEALLTFMQNLRKSFPGLRILCSFGYLVCMPFTPLQHLHYRYGNELDQNLSSRLLSLVKNSGFEGRAAFDANEHSISQFLLSCTADSGHILLEKMYHKKQYYLGRLEATSVNLLPDAAELPRGGPDFSPSFSFLLEDSEIAKLKKTTNLEIETSKPSLPYSHPNENSNPLVASIASLEASKRHAPSFVCELYLPDYTAFTFEEWKQSWVIRQLAANLDAGAILQCKEIRHSKRDEKNKLGFWYGLSSWEIQVANNSVIEEIKTSVQFKNISINKDTNSSYHPAYRWHLKSKDLARIGFIVAKVLEQSHCPATMIKTSTGQIYEISKKNKKTSTIQWAEIKTNQTGLSISLEAKDRWSPALLSEKLEAIQGLVAVEVYPATGDS